MPDPYDDIIAAASGRPRRNYDDIINRHAQNNSLDPDLVRALMSQESSGNRTAVSPKGAQGLMQLMPATAQRFGVKDPNDPEQNIAGGTKYLKFLSDKFKGDPDLVLAGYNAGEGAVEKFGNKIPPYRETQQYVPAIKARYQKLTGQQLKSVSQRQDPYDVIVEAASGQPQKPKTYDDVVSAATPQEPSRSAGMAQTKIAPRPQVRSPLKTPAVTSTVKEADTGAEILIEQKVEPIKFQPNTSEPSNLLVRAAQRAQGAMLPQGKMPETHPDLTASPLKAQFDKLPETNEAVDALMAQISPQALKANQAYRAETGRNIGLASNDISSLATQTPEGKYEVSAAPTQRLIRTINAYNRGGLSEAQSENAKMEKEADDFRHEQLKNLNQQSTSALKEGLASAGTGDAQYLYNLSMLGRALYTKSLYGDESPEYKALEKEDAENQRLLTAAQQGTLPKSTLGEIVGAVGELPQITAAGGNMPVAAYVRHLNEGQVNAGLAAIKSIPVQAMFQGVGAATGNLPRIQQELATRTAAGTFNAATAPQGQRARAFATGALLPIPMSRGERSEAQTEAQPNIETNLAEQKSAVVSEGVSPGMASVLEQRSAEASDVGTQDATPRHVDFYSRRQRNTKGGDAGEFRKQSKAERESRLAQVKPPTEVITPADDTNIGQNSAGEQLYERSDGSRYRMRRDRSDRPNGYPDFGGDLVPVVAKAEREARLAQIQGGTPTTQPEPTTSPSVSTQAEAPTSPEIQKPAEENWIDRAERLGQEIKEAREQAPQPAAEQKGGWIKELETKPAASPARPVEGAAPLRIGERRSQIVRGSEDGNRIYETKERRASGTYTTYSVVDAAGINHGTFESLTPYKVAGRRVKAEGALARFESLEQRAAASPPPVEPTEAKGAKPLPYFGHLKQDTVTGFPDPQRIAEHANESMIGGERWRYEPTDKTVYWTTENPSQESKFKVEDWLARRGQSVEAHKPVTEYNRPAIIRKLAAQVGNEPAESNAPIIDRTMESIRTPEGRNKAVEKIAGRVREDLARDEPLTDSEKVDLERMREPSTTSARKAQMAVDRAELDLPELPKAERKSWQTSLSNAKPETASLLADEVLNKPRALNDEETASLVVRAQEIKNEHSKVMKEIGDVTNPEDIATKKAQAEALEREFDKLTTATKRSGTEKGRALAAQKLTINQDYDLVSMLNRAKAAKGRELTSEERARYETQAKQIADLEQKLVEANDKLAIKQIQREIDRTARKQRRSETRKGLDDEFADLRAQLAQAKLETRRGVQGAGLAAFDPEGKITPIIAKMARNRVRAGITDAAQIVDDIHAAVSEHFENLTKSDIRDAILAPQRDVKRSEYANQLADVRSQLKRLNPETGKVISPRDKTRQTQLLKQEAELQRRLSEGDFSPAPKREPVVYSRETAALQRRIDEVKQKYNRELYKATRSIGGRIADEVAKSAGVMKTIKSMGDVSAMFRQGGFYALTHPIEGLAKPTKAMLQSFTDAGYRNVEQAIKSDSDFDLARRSGVEFTGVDRTDPQLSKKEEGYIGKEYLEYIPVARQVANFSERTFVSFLDSQRMHIFKQLADGLRARGLTPEKNPQQFKAIANLVNIGTGRGTIPRFLGGNQAAPVLNVGLFSPRLIASRVELLNKMFNPVAMARMPKGTRAAMIKDNVKFIGATLAVMGLAKAMGGQVSTDPDDGDFLKIRFGNTTYDTLTGLAQPMRFMMNMASAAKADATGSDTYAGKSKGEIVGRFARSKLSPVAGTTLDYLTGKDFSGRKFDLKRAARESITPLPVQDVIDAFKQDGLLGAVKATPTFTGVGVQTYPVNPEKPKTRGEKLARKIISQSMPDEARTDEQIDLDQKKSDLRARARRGEDVSKEVKGLGLSVQQEKTILSARGTTRLQNDFKRLSLKDAVRVYSVLSSSERAAVKDELETKASSFPLLSTQDQLMLKPKLEALGMKPGFAAKKPKEVQQPRGARQPGYVFQ